MANEIVRRDGDLVLLDCDCDPDPIMTDRLYCIAFISEGDRYLLTFVWRRGDAVRTLSAGTPPPTYQYTNKNAASFARLLSAAQDLLDGVK